MMQRSLDTAARLGCWLNIVLVAAAGCANADNADAASEQSSPLLSAGSGAATASDGHGGGIQAAAVYDDGCWRCPPGETPESGNCTPVDQRVCDALPWEPPPPPPPPPPPALHNECRLETVCGEDPASTFSFCVFGYCAWCEPFATCIDKGSTQFGKTGSECPAGPCMMP